MTQQAAIDAHFNTLLNVVGIQAAYKRGETEIPLKVIKGKQDLSRMGAAALNVQQADASFIARVSDLGDEIDQPEEGDQLIVSLGGRNQTFELHQQQDGKRAWYYETGNTFIRLMMNLVGDATAS